MKRLPKDFVKNENFDKRIMDCLYTVADVDDDGKPVFCLVNDMKSGKLPPLEDWYWDTGLELPCYIRDDKVWAYSLDVAGQFDYLGTLEEYIEECETRDKSDLPRGFGNEEVPKRPKWYWDVCLERYCCIHDDTVWEKPSDFEGMVACMLEDYIREWWEHSLGMKEPFGWGEMEEMKEEKRVCTLEEYIQTCKSKFKLREYGTARLAFLCEYQYDTWFDMARHGESWEHCQQIDDEAEDREEQMVRARMWPLESMKNTDPIGYGRLWNNERASVREIIFKEMIHV